MIFIVARKVLKYPIWVPSFHVASAFLELLESPYSCDHIIALLKLPLVDLGIGGCIMQSLPDTDPILPGEHKTPVCSGLIILYEPSHTRW